MSMDLFLLLFLLGVAELGQRLFRLGRALVVGVAPQEFLEGRARVVCIVEVICINLPDGEEGLHAVFTSGIFPAQEQILANGGMQVFLSGRELAPHLRQQLSNRHDAFVRLR